jgi:hypothetical protein
MRSRGAVRRAKQEGVGGYSGEKTGINPRARHSESLWNTKMV